MDRKKNFLRMKRHTYDKMIRDLSQKEASTSQFLYLSYIYFILIRCKLNNYNY